MFEESEVALIERSVQIDLSKDVNPNTIKKLNAKFVFSVLKKVEKDLKKKDKNVKIEKWKAPKNQKKNVKKKKDDSDDENDDQEDVKNDSLLLNVIFYEHEVKEKDFRKKFFD